MHLTGRTIVGLSALMSAALAAGLLVIDGKAQARTTPLKIEERHPELSGVPASLATIAASSAATTVATKRADRLADAGDCANQSWPYVTAECLANAGRQPVRTITIEHRVGENTSVLLRVPGQVARN